MTDRITQILVINGPCGISPVNLITINSAVALCLFSTVVV